MANEKINIPYSSKNFEGAIADFLRTLDDPRALGRYVLDKAARKSFFKGFPGLILTKVQSNGQVGDEFLIDEKWNISVGGPGMPGPYRTDRQLAGNEDIIDAAFRRDRMTVGMRRYAVAVENFLQSNLLPNPMVEVLRNNLTNWATMMEDLEVAATLFRDFSYYMAEVNSLSNAEIDRRVLPLFGRGSLNDVEAAPIVMYPNGKSDIEDLDESDTLSDVFLREAQQVADQEIGMTPLSLQDGRPFYGLVTGDPDIQNFYVNSSAQLTDVLKSGFTGKGWDNPLFSLVLGEFAGIRLFRYGWLTAGDATNEYASWESVYKHLMGNPFTPMAKVLGAARGDESVAGLRIWNRGDYSANPSERSGLDGNSNTYNLYVSVGAIDFPFFNGGEISFGAYSVKVGENSYNKAVVGVYDGDGDGAADNIEGLSYSSVSENDIVGRFQIGESNSAGGKYKVVYTGPYYVGLLQIGDNKTPYAQMHTVYRFKIEALYRWDGSNWILVGDSDIATEFNNLKTFLGINGATNVVEVGGDYAGLTYQKNRKVHIFNTVRTILFGKALMYEAEIGNSARVVQMKDIDYGASDGWGITVINGKKLKRASDGSLRGYAVVVYKRPPILS